MRGALDIRREVIHEGAHLVGGRRNEVCVERVPVGTADPVLHGSQAVTSRLVRQEGGVDLDNCLRREAGHLDESARCVAHNRHVVGHHLGLFADSAYGLTLPQLGECHLAS